MAMTGKDTIVLTPNKGGKLFDRVMGQPKLIAYFFSQTIVSINKPIVIS
jgi:hypothetical protein